jgi:hypothetical protein
MPSDPFSKRGSAQIMAKKKTAARPSKRTEDRRSSPRKAYAQQILAANDGKARGLISSDLSPLGMRVEPDDSLALGDELRLALYGNSRLPPVLVEAVVAREDGDEGWMLQFRDIGEETAAQLTQLIDSLPDIDAPVSPGVLVSEILERREDG